jgi:hypothetical protein
MDQEFAIGEIVQDTNGNVATIKEAYGKNRAGFEEYYIEYADGRQRYVYGTSLSRSSIKPKKDYSKCECGAKHTSFPNMHSDWCPMYRSLK